MGTTTTTSTASTFVRLLRVVVVACLSAAKAHPSYAETRTWERVFGDGEPPSERNLHSAVVHPNGRSMLILGGRRGNKKNLSDVHQFHFGTDPLTNPSDSSVKLISHAFRLGSEERMGTA